jgi:molecular chaperone DnaK (HSP70)
MHVGIDLGTTSSLIARIDPQGRPVLVPDSLNRELFSTPSVVYVDGRAAFVGGIVDMLLEQDPGLPVVRYFKQHFGESTPVVFDARGTAWSAEAIAALVLKKLRYDAESFTALGVDGAVVTVPAHFNDRQRKAVQAAALLADVPLLGLVEEPVAAALHYGVVHAAHERVLLVFDWGGGTFDATVLSLDEQRVCVLAKTGLTDLGGRDIDHVVGARILESLETPPALAGRTLLELSRIAEQMKIDLCRPRQRAVKQMVLLGGAVAEVTIRFEDFAREIAPLVDRAEACALDCVQQAGLAPSDVHAVLLVGGSSMVPLVRERLTSRFGAPDQRIMFHEPMKAVALGAALRTAQLTGEAERSHVPPEFRGVTGHAVGVQTADVHTGRIVIDTLIKQNMPLPVKTTKTYYATRADQDRIALNFVQYRQGDEAQAVKIGQLIVGPLPAPRRNYPVEVTVESLEDGTVRVHAWDGETGVQLQQTFGSADAGEFGHLVADHALVRSMIINNP